MELTEKQIEEINRNPRVDSWNQGIFFQPHGVPNNMTEKVIYWRQEVGGVSGGSYWEDSNPEPYQKDTREDEFTILDIVLEVLMPSITYLQYKKISDIIHTSEETDYEYYGNSTDYVYHWIKLSELYDLLKTFQK